MLAKALQLVSSKTHMLSSPQECKCIYVALCSAKLNNCSSRNRARAPFKITIAGEGFYMVTDPKDGAQVYKNNTSLSFLIFIKDLMLSCGTSQETVDKMIQEPPLYITSTHDPSLNPRKKSLISLAIDFHHVQLLPGPKSQCAPITATFIKHIEACLQWNNLSQDLTLVGKRTACSIEQVSLNHFCRKVLVEAGTKTYWGQTLWKLAPDMLETLHSLDRTMWKLLFRYPDRFSKDALRARDTIIGILTQYYSLPREERADAAWFTHALETESRAAGLNEKEMASAILIVYFV